MARSGINKVILVGNLGQDPEVKYTAGGAAVTTLSLATSESWKDKDSGQDQERTEWHRVVLWRRLAEIAGDCAEPRQLQTITILFIVFRFFFCRNDKDNIL